MNTTQLECFTTLASTLNYMRTAEELALTQPAVSRQIQSLEQELGTKLFHRTTRSVSLTQMGAAFLPEAESMLNIYYRAKGRISHFNESGQQVLRIGYSDALVARLFPAFLSPMMAEDPQMSLQFTLDQTDANLQRLTREELDLVFGVKDAKFAETNISFVPLHEEHFIFAIRKDLPLGEICQEQGLQRISSQDFFPYRQIIDIPPYLLKHVFSQGARLFPVNEEVDNILCANASEVYALLFSGAGYALVPEHLAFPDDRLLFLPWTGSPHTPLGIYAETKEAKGKTPVAAFIRQAEEFYRKFGSSGILVGRKSYFEL